MKLHLLPFSFLFAALSFGLPLQIRAKDSAPVPAAPSVPWSVLGAWKCTHPDWTGTIVFAADGRFFLTGDDYHDSGRWTLASLQDRVMLVLAWDKWPVETVTMMSPDEFSATVRSGGGQMGVLKLIRIAAPSKPAAYETKVWRQGEPPVRLIHKDEGFCALTMVTGSFQGGGRS